MSANSTQRIRSLSPLAEDLALSQTSLAVLKVQGGVEPDEEERLSAAQLRDYYRMRLDMFRGRGKISASVVPEDSMRLALQEMLSTSPPIRLARRQHDEQVLDEVLPLLGKLAEHRKLNEAEATQLLKALEKLESRREEENSLPSVDILHLIDNGR